MDIIIQINIIGLNGKIIITNKKNNISDSFSAFMTKQEEGTGVFFGLFIRFLSKSVNEFPQTGSYKNCGSYTPYLLLSDHDAALIPTRVFVGTEQRFVIANLHNKTFMERRKGIKTDVKIGFHRFLRSFTNGCKQPFPARSAFTVCNDQTTTNTKITTK